MSSSRLCNWVYPHPISALGPGNGFQACADAQFVLLKRPRKNRPEHWVKGHPCADTHVYSVLLFYFIFLSLWTHLENTGIPQTWLKSQ